MEELDDDMKHLLLYYFRKGKNAWQAHLKLRKLYGYDAFTERQCIHWFARFRFGDFTLEDIPRSARPVEHTIDLKTLVNYNPLITIREISEKLNVSQRLIRQKLKKLGYVKKLNEWTLEENLNSKKDTD